MSDCRFSIVLPVHDQADHLVSLVDEYVAALAKLEASYEIILIPNGCRDASESVCQTLAAAHPAVRVVASKQAGWGHAVQLGLRAARGDLLCYTNSARTAAADLLLLLLYARTYSDAVIKANRKIRAHWTRRLGSLLYNLECRALFDLSNWDINGTPKVFSRRFEQLLALRHQDDLIDLELNVICRREGYPILEVPIFSDRRHGGRSTTTLRTALRLYVGAYRLWRETR